jgi:hypothetical protein
MKRKKMIHIAAIATALVFCFGIQGIAQTQTRADEPIAAIAADAAEIRFQPRVDYARLILRVSTPSGDVFSREFEAGTVPTFSLVDENGSKLPDGNYVYELRVAPRLTRDVREALAAARAKGDDQAVRDLERSGKLTTQAMVQSGSFSVKDGAAYAGGAEEPKTPADPNVSVQSAGKKKAAGTGVTPLDVVTPDDIIVQGSACIGLDCVNNESFGFDTIRLKENNTRIKFDDTSTGAGFPANDWQLTANDSASGGANKFSIEDITGSKVPFTVIAGAPTNSVFVASTGKVGLRTSTPVLDLHINTSDTPAHRLEQNNSGGFTAQTWDIAGNEANFFIRDVTGGSRLPFRIRPGAPTSSIDISASGDVGVGTASPGRKLELSGTGNVGMKITDTSISNAAFLLYLRNTNASLAGRQFSIFDENAAVDRLVINASGQIGFGGALNPTNPLEHGSGARLTAAGVWTNASSRALKMNIRGITALEALRTLPALKPVKFEYKAEPGETYAGFIAEDVPDLVAQSDRRTLSPMDIVAVLTKVVQEQQKTINTLKAKMSRLEKRVAAPAQVQKTSRR